MEAAAAVGRAEMNEPEGRLRLRVIRIKRFDRTRRKLEYVKVFLEYTPETLIHTHTHVGDEMQAYILISECTHIYFTHVYILF